MITPKPSQAVATTLYLPADFFLLRTPTLPAQTFQNLSASRLVESASRIGNDIEFQEQRSATQHLILDVCNHPQVEKAIAVASPSLYQSLVQFRRGETSLKRTNTLFSGLLRYLIRMSTRPTPFGLFSGVALGSFGEKTTAQLGTPVIKRTRTRPDMNWMLAMLKRLETVPSLVIQLTVQTNQLAYISGERAFLPCSDTYGQSRSQAVSLRATPVVCKALELAREPLPFLSLQDALLYTFPGSSQEQVERLLRKLWEYGLLTSTLHPSLSDAQPAHILLQQLKPFTEAEEFRHILDHVLAACVEFDAQSTESILSPLHRLARLQDPTSSIKKPDWQIQTDSLLSLPATSLHTNVGAAAAHAAELLLRLTPFPQGSPDLQDYIHRFLEKYGFNAEVPLLELLSSEQGLGAPTGYTQPPPVHQTNETKQHSSEKQRERTLLILMQEALNNHSLEAKLSEAHLAALETWKPHLTHAPRSLEISLQIQADSREALDTGNFRAVIGPTGSLAVGRSFGRFFDLLGEPSLRAFQKLFRYEEALEPDAIFAELSYQPIFARNTNVAVRPALRAYQIAVGTTPTVPPEQVIPLHDLVVGVHNENFYLRSLRLNRRVIVCQSHMLTLDDAPNACRFIAEVASDEFPLLAHFDWGNLSTAPFLPRLTVPHGSHASIVLTPASWNLQAKAFSQQDSDSAQTDRFASLQAWRTRWRVPQYVYLTEADNRLLLDLEHPLMVAELFRELDALKEGQILTLQELLPDFEHLWLTDTQGALYFSEIVVPLLRRDAPIHHQLVGHQPPEFASAPSTPSQHSHLPSVSHVVAREVRVFSPGDAWNYVKLYGATIQQDEIIAGPLRELVSLLNEQHLLDRWFFLRYTDPQPHLRLRIHTNASEQIPMALNMLLSWSQGLVTRGLIQRFSLDTYEREVARYGGPMSIDLIEQVFHFDSELCSNLIAAQYTHHLLLDPLTVAVVSLDRLFTAWGFDLNQRLQWVQERTKKYTWKGEFHIERKRAGELISLWNRQADAELMAQRNKLDLLTNSFISQVSPLAMQIRELAKIGQFWTTEGELLASLAHLHNIRLLDLDIRKEQKVYAFWRSTLESIQRRPVDKGLGS